ncbi:hypothetical protein QYE76_029698 [Lolium multiflorum]|uniref:Aminotransferase-like plant mobile domain-containing protein n=1 Tax=Lolium multiflorum TaxID=4521 RepID=A0AAD8QPG2_LOLMU|nr:hypothetical protein QYE76_029698 [Lolium multiflorum]
MAESSNANATVSGLKVSDILLPHPSLPNSLCLGPRSTESPAHLISCEANRIPFVNQNLDLTSWADCLRAWPNPPEDWVSWYSRVSKTHQAKWETTGIADALSLSLSPLEKHENLLKTIGYFWSDALNCFMFGHGPMTPTLLDVAMITGLDIASPSPSAFMLPKQQDGPELVHDDGSPFKFFPPAPVVLFCKNSPPLKKVVMQSQPVSPKSASKSKVSSGPAAPRASIKARMAVRKVATRKTLKRQNPTPAQESLHASLKTTPARKHNPVEGFEFGQLWENHHAEPARFATIGFQEKTDDTSSGEVEEVLMPSANLDLATSKGVVDKGCDLSGLLSFDPESIEPAPSTACDEPGPSAILGQFQRLKALLSSSIETLVEDPEEVKSILEEIQPHLPVKGEAARQRIDLRHAQLPLKADIADKCQRLNEKKAALDAKTDTSVSSAELETLRKELEDLEERVRATKQLISIRKLIARSQEEAEGLKAQLKTDLAEIRALNKQLVTGKDEDDEAEIAEVDRVRADALRAFEAFLQ